MASGMYVATARDGWKNAIALDHLSALNKLALYASTLTPNFNADPATYSTSNEVTGTNYTAGGIVIPSPTLTVSGGALVYDAGDMTWSNVTITPHGASAYADGLTPKALIWTMDFLADFPCVAGNFVIQWHPSGIWTLDLTP